MLVFTHGLLFSPFLTAFFASSLTLAYLSSQRGGEEESLLEGAPAVEAEQPAPEEEVVPDTDTDMPVLEPVEDTIDTAEDDAEGDMPALEDE